MIKKVRKIFSKKNQDAEDSLVFREVNLDELPSVQSDTSSIYEYIGTPSPISKTPDYNTLTVKDNVFHATVLNSPGAKVVFTEIVNDSGVRELQPAASDNPEEIIYISLGAIKLIESLQLLYQTEEAVFVPFPWLRNSQYDAEDHFVPLKLDEWNKSGQKLIESDIELERVLATGNNTPGPRRVLVQAQPGSGKTTICTRLAYLWAQSHDSMSRFTVAILVRLKNIEGETLEDYIIKFCHRATLERNSITTVRNILKDLGHELLLILDGFDETTDAVRQSVNDVLGFKKRSSCQSFLRGATIVTTSRPLKELDNSRCFDRRIRIEGMKPENRDAFIDRYVRDRTAAQNLKDLLKQTSFADTISPLTLTILCFLQDKDTVTKFQTEWEMIETILNTWGERCVKNEDLPYKGWHISVIYYKLGKMYFDNRYVTAAFTEKQLLETFNEDELRFLKGCSLLVKTPGFHPTRDGEDTYEPVHKTFVEFLIANYLKWEYDKKYTTKAKQRFLVELIRPSIERVGIKAFDIDSSGEIMFTCCVVDGVYVIVTFKNPWSQIPNVHCKFSTSSFASTLSDDIRNKESLIKIRSIIKLFKFDSKCLAIPPQFRLGIDYLCPTTVKYPNGVTFTYNIYRESRHEFDPGSLAIIDDYVKDVNYFEYDEQASETAHTKDECHGNREIVTMLQRAIDISTAVSCTTLFFNWEFKLIRMFPANHMNTLETVGPYAILQQTLRHFTKHYLKCKEPFYAVPEAKLDVRDFLTRFFKSLRSCSVTAEVVATWNYHGHVFLCVHDPMKKMTQAYHANPKLNSRKPSVAVNVDKMVSKIATVAHRHSFTDENFHIQLSVSPVKISLTVNLREGPLSFKRTVKWQFLRIRKF